MRALTVHFGHVATSHSGYIPPTGGADLYFRPAPKLVPDVEPEAGGGVHLVFREEHYVMVELLGGNVQALDFCTGHLAELTAFLKTRA